MFVIVLYVKVRDMAGHVRSVQSLGTGVNLHQVKLSRPPNSGTGGGTVGLKELMLVQSPSARSYISYPQEGSCFQHLRPHENRRAWQPY